MIIVETKHGLVTYDGIEYTGPKKGIASIQEKIEFWAPLHRPNHGDFQMWVSKFLGSSSEGEYLVSATMDYELDPNVVY